MYYKLSEPIADKLRASMSHKKSALFEPNTAMDDSEIWRRNPDLAPADIYLREGCVVTTAQARAEIRKYRNYKWPRQFFVSQLLIRIKIFNFINKIFDMISKQLGKLHK